MDKFAERKKFTSCKLVAAAAVAMCLLGSAGFEANAAPAPQVVSAQKATLTISGTVKDSKGEPVIGANVMEKGTNRGIVTDLDGKFTLKVTPGATITVSYLGYKTQTLKAAPTMNVSLEEDNALLDEVVVVGFGTQKRANLTGAVATVDVSKVMDNRPVTDADRVGQGHYCPLPPSEPYVRVSPHTAQAFQSLCSCAETGSYYFLFPLDLRDNLKHSS